MLNAKLKREFPLHLMLIPGLIIVFIFSYGPMFGLIMAFQNFDPAAGFLKSVWVGLDNFKYILTLEDTRQVLWNTVYISSMKIVVETIASIVFALMLNEVSHKWFKKSVQTIVYFPYFLSWIILGSILRDVLSADGIVNKFLGIFHIHPIMFLGDNKIFPFVLVLTEAWQVLGFGAIVYLAALTSISPTLYEAAVIDGANRWQQTLHITLPGMKSTIVLMVTLSLGNILNAGFDQIFVLYNPLVYQSGDVIDTWVYRMGLVSAQYSIGAAVGLFRSVVSFILISLSYYLAYKFADYQIF